MTPIEVARVLDFLADGIDVLRPDDWPEIGPGTAESREIRLSIRESSLAEAIERRLANPKLCWADGVLIAVAHDSANAHRAEGRHSQARADFQRVVELSPHDYNVRVALSAYADPVTEHQIIYDLLRPFMDVYRREPGIYADALDRLARAAVTGGDLVAASQTVGSSGPYSERLALLTTAPATEPTSVAETLLDHAILAMDEWTQIDCLEKALASVSHQQAATASFLTRAVFCARVSRHHNWARPYRACCRAVARALACGAPSGILVEEWTAQGLPMEALVALNQMALIDPAGGVTTTSLAADVWLLALERPPVRSTSAAPSAATEWARLWRAGEFAQFLRVTPHGGVGKPKSAIWQAIAGLRRAALAVLDTPRTAEMVDLWFFITWHEDPYQLLSLLSALSGDHIVPIVSIGGDGLPPNLGVTSIPLMLDRFQFIFNPTVVWGGQRLLFQNLFLALKAFGERASDGDRLQVICNRTYPLLPPSEICALLARSDFTERFPGLAAPPIWHQEWPPELVEDLPALFDDAMGAVFKNCDGKPFHAFSTYKGIFDSSDFRKDQVAFNFSPGPLPMSDRNRSFSHNYSISGYAADMRWMSFGRLMEFVDVSSEAMATYSRRLHPVVERWVHGVLSSHNLRTGDPFILTTPKLAREVHANPECFELFSAMNLGFGPEMNFFDTVAMTPKYGLAGHAEHLYLRTATGLALDSDLRTASHAADVEKRLFIRKTNPLGSALTEFFAKKIEADRGHADYYVALIGNQRTGAPTAKRWTPRDLLEDILPGLVAELRDLFSEPFARIVFLAEGMLETADGVRMGDWSWTASGALEIVFLNKDWGVKRYGALTANGRRVTLPPEEVVSKYTGWGVFLDIDVFALPSARTDVMPVIDSDCWRDALLAPTVCTGASRMEVALLGAFTAEEVLDPPGLWARHDYRFHQLRRLSKRIYVLMDIDGAPVVGRLRQVAYGDSRAAPVLDFGGFDTEDDWRQAAEISPAEAGITFGRANCVGEWTLYLLDSDVSFELTRDSRIRTSDGETGIWVLREQTLWIVGLSQAPLIVVSQFVWTDNVWTLSGWCSRGLGDLTSFSLKPLN